MKIAPGVEMLEISSTLNGEPNTIYPSVLWDSAAAILVDAGFPGQLALIRAAVEQAGVAFERLDTILLTHQDIDHIGCVNPIRAERPGRVHVLCHTLERPYVQGDLTPLKLAQLEANLKDAPAEAQAMYEKLKSGFQASFTPVDSVLADGQVLPYLGGITIVLTPGHTPGHICLYLKQSKTLIAGDALRVKAGQLIQTPARMNFDMQEYRESLLKLAKYEIENAICYHGGLYRGMVSQRIAELAAA